jgi:hypothetical protein
MGQLVLKRFLLLVLLLDKAATHLTAAFRTPLLFKLTSSIKSSRQVRKNRPHACVNFRHTGGMHIACWHEGLSVSCSG